MRNVIFYGPLGKANSKVVGGGESGNHKTLSILGKAGLNVLRLRKPYSSESIIGKISYVLHLYYMPLLLLFHLLTKRKVEVVHLSGFYKHLIYQEILLIYVVKLLGKKCIYELRAGGVKESYLIGSNFYQHFFRKAIALADVILVQGKRYVEFLNTLGAKEVVHYPNYILGDFIQRSTNLLEHGKCVKLVYFGRMSVTKNILFMLDICKELKNKFFFYELELIGEGNIEYIKQIKEKISTNQLSANIRLSPPAFGESLVEKLKDKHFFIFPTQEPREGHSNSLTEAMSLGIVPICSNYGFNKEVVGIDDLVIKEFDATLYASKIEGIVFGGAWQKLSSLMQKRVLENYTEEKVEIILKDVYNLF